MVFFLLLLVSLPFTATFPISKCELCPLQSQCVLDSHGTSSCVCDEGFSGDNCDILLCHDFFCLGSLSICENTLQGPICHCEESRAGSNCELQSGEQRPWSRCSNATFCEASFQDGKCDEICNTPECLFDGNDCLNNDHSSEEVTATTFPSSHTPTIPAPEMLSSTKYVVLLIFMILLVIVITIILVVTHCIVKKRKNDVAVDFVPALPSYTLPPTPYMPNYQIHIPDNDDGYAVIPFYATLPIFDHSEAQSYHIGISV